MLPGFARGIEGHGILLRREVLEKGRRSRR